MNKTILSLEKKLQRIRTGRANPSLLESVEVDYYGSNTPISQMSNISVEDARTLSIVPWEKDQVQNIEKAIQSSDIGLQPATSGDVIRVIIPELTEETRKDLIKVLIQYPNINNPSNFRVKNLEENFFHFCEDHLRLVCMVY